MRARHTRTHKEARKDTGRDGEILGRYWGEAGEKLGRLFFLLLHLDRGELGGVVALRITREQLHAELLPRREPCRHHDTVVRAVRRRHAHELAALDGYWHGDGEAGGDGAEDCSAERPAGHHTHEYTQSARSGQASPEARAELCVHSFEKLQIRSYLHIGTYVQYLLRNKDGRPYSIENQTFALSNLNRLSCQAEASLPPGPGVHI